MASVQKWLQANLSPVFMVFFAGGFVMILVELVITDHLDGTQLVGVVASVVGALLTLAALFVTGRARLIVAGLLVLLSLTGLLGTYEHYEAANGGEEALRPASLTLANQPVRYALEEEEEEGEAGEAAGEAEGGEEVPPPLAPLSLAGLSLMAALAIVGIPEKPTR